MSVRSTEDDSDASVLSAISTDPTDLPVSEECSYAYIIRLTLKHGRNLVSKDALTRKSDPYVLIKLRGSDAYKSDTVLKTVDPVWGDEVVLYLNGLEDPLLLEVYDWNRLIKDDFMGSAPVNVADLQLNVNTPLKLLLSDPEKQSSSYMGYLALDARLEEYNSTQISPPPIKLTKASVRRRNRARSVQQTVNITLVEGRELSSPALSSVRFRRQLPSPYVKFKLGSEKYKSKVIDSTMDPKWAEQFGLVVNDESQQHLVVVVKDKSSRADIGQLSIDLSKFKREHLHRGWFELEKAAGAIRMLISITGTLAYKIPSSEQSELEHAKVAENYKLHKSLHALQDVGTLTVKVFRATGVASADIGGSSDPFCMLELVNARLRTHAVSQTLNPEWNKVFTFKLRDLHCSLHVDVYDEDGSKKVEFLGKVVIPMLHIKNGVQRWYVLKDKKLSKRAKGQILLEMTLIYNPIRAIFQTFQPPEVNYHTENKKFKPSTLISYADKMASYGFDPAGLVRKVNRIWAWEDRNQSAMYFVAFELGVLLFEPYMIPLILLILMCRARYKAATSKTSFGQDEIAAEFEDYYESSESEEETGKNQGDKMSMKQRLNDVSGILAKVQKNFLRIISTLDRLKNLFNFSDPFLSYIAMMILFFATVLMYILPLRYLLMLWGVKKFTEKLRCPEIKDEYFSALWVFLQRVPTDKDKKRAREYMPHATDEEMAVKLATFRKRKLSFNIAHS